MFVFVCQDILAPCVRQVGFHQGWLDKLSTFKVVMVGQARGAVLKLGLGGSGGMEQSRRPTTGFYKAFEKIRCSSVTTSSIFELSLPGFRGCRIRPNSQFSRLE